MANLSKSSIQFTDNLDPKPRSREVFTFHRPETLKDWTGQEHSLRARLNEIAKEIAAAEAKRKKF